MPSAPIVGRMASAIDLPSRCRPAMAGLPSAASVAGMKPAAAARLIDRIIAGLMLLAVIAAFTISPGDADRMEDSLSDDGWQFLREISSGYVFRSSRFCLLLIAPAIRWAKSTGLSPKRSLLLVTLLLVLPAGSDVGAGAAVYGHRRYVPAACRAVPRHLAPFPVAEKTHWCGRSISRSCSTSSSAIMNIFPATELIPLTLGDVVVLGEWRSSALLGHPLTGVRHRRGYVLALILRPALCPSVALRPPADRFCLGSLMVFGGRTALVTVLLVIGGIAAPEIFRILRGGRTPLPVVIVAICLLFIGSAVSSQHSISASSTRCCCDFRPTKAALWRVTRPSTCCPISTGVNWFSVRTRCGQMRFRPSMVSTMDRGFLGLLHRPVRHYSLRRCSQSDWSACLRKCLQRASSAAWAIVLLVLVIAASFGQLFIEEHPARAVRSSDHALVAARAAHRCARAPWCSRQAPPDPGHGLRPGQRMAIYVDHTHLGRHVTGLERITIELFSPAALAPLDIVPVTAHGTRQMVTNANLWAADAARRLFLDLAVPGFSTQSFAAAIRGTRPSLHSRHFPAVAPGRPQSPRPALYGGAFQACAAPLPPFSRQFQRHASKAGSPLPARRRDHALSTAGPQRIQSSNRTAARCATARPLRLVALGTVEPRKNFLAAARITSALRARGFPGATLDIVGRQGWGDDWESTRGLSRRDAARLSAKRRRPAIASGRRHLHLHVP